MPDDLYDRDILLWSERQAALLRQVARGERLNEAVDWDHVIEEVEDVGLSQLHACESFLRQALVHLLKLRSHPQAPSAVHRREEVVRFLTDAQERFAPSMRRRIDMDKLYRRAKRQAAGGRKLAGDREPCPYMLDELLDEEAEVEALLAKFG